MSKKFKANEIEVEAFQFYVDNIPDWFMDKVTDNTIMLCDCDYRQFSQDEAHCMIQDQYGKVTRCNGGDMVIRFKSGNITHIHKGAFDALFYGCP
jgi:hypothetical protein